MSNELMHYGVPGMRWGRRKTPQAENYSTKQRAQDRALYGRGGEKRINKRMLSGEGIKTARHYEVERKERREHGKMIAKNIAKGGVIIGGTIAATALVAKYGGKLKDFSPTIVDTTVSVGRNVVNALFR